MSEPQFYSQHQEDFFIRHYMDKHDIKPFPFFVDIGSCDGIHLNNCRHFAELGWGGVFVEPSKHYFQKLQKNYEHRADIVTYECAIGNTVGWATFKYYPENPDHSGLIGEDGLKNAVEYEVFVTTFDRLREKTIPFSNRIGVLSIDAEGVDTDILRQVIASGVTVDFVVIESNTTEARRAQVEMLNKSFHLINVFDVNTIWIRRNLLTNK